MEQTTTKVCQWCGKEKQISEFVTNNRRADGHTNVCKECTNRRIRENYAAKKQMGGVKSQDPNNPLSAFQPRELIAELRRRGYAGELKYTQVIKV